MKYINVLIIFITLSVASLANCLPGEGKIIKDNIYLPSVNSIEVNVPMTLVITQDDDESILVKTNEDVLRNLNFEYSGGDLTIVGREDLCPENLTVYISISKLTSLELNSKTNVTATNKLICEDLDLEINEESTVHLSLDAEEVSLDIDDGSETTLSGTTGDLYVHVEGSGKANTSSLKAENVEAELDGTGEITVNPSESLQAQLNGSGNIYYKNKPAKLEIDKDGTGSIIKMR